MNRTLWTHNRIRNPTFYDAGNDGVTFLSAYCWYIVINWLSRILLFQWSILIRKLKANICLGFLMLKTICICAILIIRRRRRRRREIIIRFVGILVPFIIDIHLRRFERQTHIAIRTSAVALLIEWILSFRGWSTINSKQINICVHCQSVDKQPISSHS